MKNGHDILLHDLRSLLLDAERFAFHDFKGEAATPKLDLVNHLVGLVNLTKMGRYDDAPDEDDKAAMRADAVACGASEEELKKFGL